MTLLTAGLLTFAVTTALTVAGVGGAFVLIPIFLALGIELHTAMATALLLNAIATSAASVRYVRSGLVAWSVTLPVLISATLTSPFGAHISVNMDRTSLLWGFVVFLIFASGMMLLYRPKARERQISGVALAGLGVTVGALAGFVGGLLGVGGGLLIAPALVLLGLPPKRASATSTFAVIFSSLSGFAGHATLKGMDLPLLSVTAVGSVSAALLGSWLMTERLRGEQIKPLLGVLLLGVAARIAWTLVYPG
ncbi:MAG: sulfite exporter TauE/SafE family protein [Deltaproteobacteria bacterium]|nr:sulfite exporter TauE/SafE family protein [Deltaproteobacteria bacterium]